MSSAPPTPTLPESDQYLDIRIRAIRTAVFLRLNGSSQRTSTILNWRQLASDNITLYANHYQVHPDGEVISKQEVAFRDALDLISSDRLKQMTNDEVVIAVVNEMSDVLDSLLSDPLATPTDSDPTDSDRAPFDAHRRAFSDSQVRYASHVVGSTMGPSVGVDADADTGPSPEGSQQE
ncbi:hypothetical protein BDZ97DRAFT_1753084 [Flammula alnicola]|nr:hypothetical protein BDZ97DRAFT_1753084 [Flammula alnicola]